MAGYERPRVQHSAQAASVEDDGGGFDAKEMQNPARQCRGLGLATIRERAEMLGGGVQAESRIEGRTKARIEIPVPSGFQGGQSQRIPFSRRKLVGTRILLGIWTV